MNGPMVKSEFENVFLAEEGQDFTIIRNGADAGIVRGIVNLGLIQCKAESDIRIGDLLRSQMKNITYAVGKVTYETVDSVRTCLEAHVSSV